jgi:hypothetical protein
MRITKRLFKLTRVSCFSDLTLNGRTEFKICVDRVGEDSSVEPSEIETVRNALNQALAAPAVLPPRYNDHAPILVEGCPKPKFLSDELVSYRERNELQSKLVVGDSLGPKTMSPYRAFVYFTEPDAYAASFGKEPYATSSEEYGCDGDVCGAVTRAIYIPYDNVPMDGLRYGLMEVLNLRSEQQVKDLLQDKLYPKTTP